MNVTRALTLLEFVSARGLDNNKEIYITFINFIYFKKADLIAGS